MLEAEKEHFVRCWMYDKQSKMEEEETYVSAGDERSKSSFSNEE